MIAVGCIFHYGGEKLRDLAVDSDPGPFYLCRRKHHRPVLFGRADGRTGSLGRSCMLALCSLRFSSMQRKNSRFYEKRRGMALIFLVRLICLAFLACLALLFILNYAPFLAMPVWIALIIALIVCLYLAFIEEMKEWRRRKH